MAQEMYQPLNTSLPEIRIFTLLPSSTGDALQGHLQAVKLTSPPPYEALSYAWGEPTLTRPISLNGHPFLITPNLDAALHHLRLQDAPRVLWVDALCIDQTSTSERAHQVTLMRTIYSQCTRDLLWLGPNPEVGPPRESRSEEMLVKGLRLLEKTAGRDIGTLEGMERTWALHLEARREEFKALQEMGGGHEQPESKGNEKTEIETLGTAGDVQRVPKKWLLSYEEKRCLVAVLQVPPVWNRLWVMQELSCAPQIQLVAGLQTLDWDVIADFLGDTPYADAFHAAFSHGFVSPMAEHFFGRVQTIQHQRGIMAQISAGGDSALLDVLARFRSAKAGDPRDKIYGLMGLTTDTLDVRVDYDKSPEQVYADVTVSIINHAGHLDILCQSPWRVFPSQQKPQGQHEDNPIMEGLPSWAVNFLANGKLLLFAQRSIFNAGRPSCEVPCRVTDGTILRTRGVALGRIGPVRQDDYPGASMDNATRPRWHKRFHLPAEWLGLYLGHEILKDPQPARPYITGESAFTAFWRTLLTDCTGYPVRRLTVEEIEKTDAAMKETVLRALNEPPRPDEDGYLASRDSKVFHDGGMQRIWDSNFEQWTFTITENGLYAMIVPLAREGDIIACLDGGKVPVVLRRLQHEGAEERYQLVTVAYVHGFMDMEATSSASLREGLRLKEQEFWLV